MKNNIIPALIIAIAIFGVAIFYQRASSGAVENFLSQLEKASVTKDANDKTQISKIMEGISKSATAGFQQGFSGGQNDRIKSEMPVVEKLIFKDIKIVSGRQNNQEKVVGIIKNESAEIISDVNVCIVYRKSDDSLLDVSATFNQIKGVLKPGAELGFEFQRELGSYKDADEVLAQKKAAKVTLTVIGVNIVK
jgi:hypothetical protein